jgi:hypothetical protein
LAAAGCPGGKLCTTGKTFADTNVLIEVRHDSEGEYYHLVTAWKATSREQQSYAENV